MVVVGDDSEVEYELKPVDRNIWLYYGVKLLPDTLLRLSFSESVWRIA